MTFLVIDDNALLNRYLTNYFRARGHKAFSLTDGARAVPWLEAHPCDGVVLDLNMPDPDGFETLTALRRKFSELPVVIFTGIGRDSETIARAKQTGANGYASKGLGPAEIYTALMRLVRDPAPCVPA